MVGGRCFRCQRTPCAMRPAVRNVARVYVTSSWLSSDAPGTAGRLLDSIPAPSPDGEVRMPKERPGVVSVVLVNFRGADDTITAVTHLRTLDWSPDRLEIVVVENGSGDDRAARLAAELPGIVLVGSDTQQGIAGGSKLGVGRSPRESHAL